MSELRCCLLIVGLLAACTWSDSRPILLNGSTEALQIESSHTDGQRLRTLLHPGARISLGIAGAPVERIEVRSDRSEASDAGILLSPQEVADCMRARTACLGWRLGEGGSIAPLRPGEL